MIGSVIVALDARTAFLIHSIACEQYPVIAVDSAVPVTRPGETPSGRLSAVASMGQGGAIAPPPILAVAPPIGSCPGHSRKPAFGNGAIAS